jgi:hypothetical protein
MHQITQTSDVSNLLHVSTRPSGHHQGFLSAAKAPEHVDYWSLI